jgi:hypothetical protein
MGHIYRHCSQARIWLGCDASECNLHCHDMERRKIVEERNDPFKLFRLMDSKSHVHEWPCFVRLENDSKMVRYEHSAAFDDIWERHCKVNDSPWWSRIWTVQEALLPSMASVMYDTWSMPFEELLAHSKVFCMHVRSCCQQVVPLLPDKSRIKLLLLANAHNLLTGDLKRLGLPGETLRLQLCSLYYGHRQCHNPRDKIYGMLGLISNESGRLAPDYSASVASVYYYATCDMLEATPWPLQALTGSRYGPSASSHKWASWVRDFDQQSTQHHNFVAYNNIMFMDALFNAGEYSPLSCERWFSWPCVPDEKPNQIALPATGRYVGTIMAIAQETCVLTADFADAFAPFKAWLDLAGFDFEAYAAGRHTRANVKIWRTLLSGVVGTTDARIWRRFEEDDMKLLQPFVSFFETGIPPTFQNDLGSVQMSTGSRKYFRTRNGDHGLCYPTCEVGDQVWVLHGARLPFILRSVHVDTNLEENVLRPPEAYTRDEAGSIVGVEKEFGPRVDGHYQLVGDCYFDGFMDGEALDDRKYPSCFILLV